MLWRDGTIQEETIAPFDLTDRGLTLGDGVFDTALCLNGKVAFGEAHLRRLGAAAEQLGFPVGLGDLRVGLNDMARRVGNGALRTTITRGSGPRGLAPPQDAKPVSWIVAAPLRLNGAFSLARLRTTAIRRNDTSPSARLKTLGYLDAVIAMGEAVRHGFDDALFLNTKGNIACAGTANIFVVIGRNIVTPPLSDGILAGVIRSELIAGASQLGLTIDQRSITPEEVGTADAMFLTNSLRLLAPVQKVDDQIFSSTDHPLVLQLRAWLQRRIDEECGPVGATP